MITFFNKLADSWIAKSILGLLALSMVAFWGLGGISNRNNFNTTAITVGSKEISIYQLQQAFDTERMKLTQLMGQQLSPKQAIEMGLLSQVIQQQIKEALQEQIHDDLGLTASNQAVQKYVERHPAFKDNLGHFDRNLFNTYLTHTRMNQAQLARALQKELANQHLANTIRLVAPAPDTLISYWQSYQNEERDIEALLIKQDKIVVNKTPSQEELKDFYDAYMDDFIQQETRDIDLVVIDPESARKNIVIPAEELETAYQEKKYSFDVPEKRDVAQIRFDSEEAAQQALKNLTIDNFEEIARQNGQSSEATNFGEVAQNEMLAELGDAAFRAKTNTLIGPIASSVGWHIVLVRKIIPARAMDKATVYANLRKQLIEDQAYDKMYQTVRDMEDLLGEGHSLAEAANQLKLSVQHIKDVDVSGAQLPENSRNNELLQQIFTGAQNEATGVVSQENNFLVAEVTHITPAATKPFENVLSEVKAKWVQDQQASMLAQTTENALENFKKGSIPAIQGDLIVEKHVKRTQAKNIPAEALGPIFKQEPGYENAISVPLAQASLISAVKKISHPTSKTDDEAVLKKQLEQELAESMYAALVSDYASRLGVDINTQVIQKAFAQYQE